MPSLQVTTNVTLDPAVQPVLLKELSVAAAELTGKPESYMMISVNAGVALTLGGTADPAAFCYFSSIGAVGGALNPPIARRFTDIISSKLGIPEDRIYLNIFDIPPSSWGWKGTTF